MIKVFIADDHPVVRQGLKRILADELDITVVGEAINAQELFKQLGNQDCDVVVLDITMPGRDGLDALNELRHTRPKLPVLVLSIHPEDQFGLRVLKAGAAGYMTKETAPDELVKAIRKVFAGGKYLSPTLAEIIAFDLDHDNVKPPHETLSDREYAVMCLLASGKTVSEVSREFSLSVKTVSTHRARILEKMNMKTNAELTHYAIKNRLVD
jgi:two-component system invasion response regulator UvrY